MGASWSATFVSSDGEEIPIPADVLSSASTVWRERLQLVGSLSPPPRSAENCTAEQIKAFVRVISLLSNDATGPAMSLPIEDLLHSLPLVHKYDCKGVKMLFDEVDAHHFREPVFEERKGIAKADSYFNVQRWLVPARDVVHLSPRWLTQTHMDYLVLKQEMYGVEANLKEPMKKLLAIMLTNRNIYEGSYFSVPDTTLGYVLHACAYVLPHVNVADSESLRVQVHHVELRRWGVTPDEDPTVDSLTLQAWRLTSVTYMQLLPHLQPNFDWYATP